MKQAVLLDGWSRVVRVEYIQSCRDGSEETHERDLLNRGDSVTVLLCNPEQSTVLLVRQPRVAVTLRGSATGETIEACRGQVQSEQPLQCARRECREELGHIPERLDLIASFYPSPGISLEICHVYQGWYSDKTRVSAGGGLRHEGEDIEVLEVRFEEALRWVREGVITDSGTIIALQSLALAGGASSRATAPSRPSEET